MAKSVVVYDSEHNPHQYKSTLFRGYRVHTSQDGVCVTEKRLFSRERTVDCYPARNVAYVESDRCIPCEVINPTQQPDA